MENPSTSISSTVRESGSGPGEEEAVKSNSNKQGPAFDPQHNQRDSTNEKQRRTIEEVSEGGLEKEELEVGEIAEDQRVPSADGNGAQDQSNVQDLDEGYEIATGRLISTSHPSLELSKVDAFTSITPTILPPSVISSKPDDVFVYTFPIPDKRFIPVLIGSRGVYAREVRDIAGVHIYYDDGPSQLFSAPCHGLIQGTLSEIHHALSLLKHHLIRAYSRPNGRGSGNRFDFPFLDFTQERFQPVTRANDISRSWADIRKGRRTVRANERRCFPGGNHYAGNWPQASTNASELESTLNLFAQQPIEPASSTISLSTSNEQVNAESSSLSFARMPKSRSRLPFAPSTSPLRILSPKPSSSIQQQTSVHSFSSSSSSQSVAPPPPPVKRRRPSSLSPSPSSSSERSHSPPRKKLRHRNDYEMDSVESERVSAIVERIKKSQNEISFEIPLPAASAFFGQTSSLPHLERITGTKLKLECEISNARLIVMNTNRETMDKIEKLKAGIEDTVRSIKGYEDWSIEKIETQANTTLDDQYPSPISLRQSDSPEVPRQPSESYPSRKSESLESEIKDSKRRNSEAPDEENEVNSKSSSVVAEKVVEWLTQQAGHSKQTRSYDSSRHSSNRLPPPAEDFISSRRALASRSRDLPPHFDSDCQPRPSRLDYRSPSPRRSSSNERYIHPSRRRYIAPRLRSPSPESHNVLSARRFSGGRRSPPTERIYAVEAHIGAPIHLTITEEERRKLRSGIRAEDRRNEEFRDDYRGTRYAPVGRSRGDPK